MDQELFDELLESVKEAGQIVKGKRSPSRTFVVDALDVANSVLERRDQSFYFTAPER
jgi:hypothetical protein